jgi:hypothetical protein
MQRFSACLAVIAMLFALGAAPLFHVHSGEDDDHHAGSLIHAHLPEAEHEEEHDHAEEPAGVHVEAPESFGHGRSIDVFALNAPALPAVQTVADLSQPYELVSPVLTRAVTSVLALRAHSPPGRSQLPPRSPPSL